MVKKASELSAAQKADVTNSWAVVKKDEANLGAEFFKKLFADFPYTEDKFENFKGQSLEKWKSDKMMKAHSVAVLSGISCFVDNINDDDIFDGLVRKMTINHKKGRNVGATDFGNAGITLVKFLEEKGVANASVKASWEAFWKIWGEISQDAEKHCK